MSTVVNSLGLVDVMREESQVSSDYHELCGFYILNNYVLYHMQPFNTSYFILWAKSLCSSFSDGQHEWDIASVRGLTTTKEAEVQTTFIRIPLMW